MAKAEKRRTTVDGRLKSIGIIMDGNGRWATKRGLTRSMGHIAGAKVISPILKELRSIGINHVTLYAFSTENWNRPKAEIDAIFKLLQCYLKAKSSTFIKNKIRFRNIF